MLCILGFTIEFKHMLVLCNEKKIMLSFSRIIKFNAIICLNSIRELKVINIKNHI